MSLQSIKSVKHNAAKSVNRSILKKSRHIGFGVFIVHSSLAESIAPLLLKLAMPITGRRKGEGCTSVYSCKLFIKISKDDM